MGHTRLGELPRTRKWLEVVGLIGIGAGTAQIANAVLSAAERGLNLGASHKGLVESVWHLLHLPLAARAPDFQAALKDLGLRVSDDLTLFEITGAMSDAIDERMANCAGQSDLGELAQAAANETVVEMVTSKASGLFGMPAESVQAALAGFATTVRMGEYMRCFFGKLMDKVLAYYVSRATAQFIGDDARFATLASKAAFDSSLTLHCQEASDIVEAYCGEWFSKANWEREFIDRDAAGAFAHTALRKLADELVAGAR